MRAGVAQFALDLKPVAEVYKALKRFNGLSVIRTRPWLLAISKQHLAAKKAQQLCPITGAQNFWVTVQSRPHLPHTTNVNFKVKLF